MSTQNITNRLTIWGVVVACLLVIPVWGNRYVEGWNWNAFDFAWAGIVLFGAAATYELVARQGGTTAYRVAVGIAVATGLVLVWINAAVGIIGDGPVNWMYFGVIAVGTVGALVAKLEPRGMAMALVAMGCAQLLVPIVALVVFNPPFDPGVVPVFILNACFVGMWSLSALLFKRAARASSSVAAREDGAT